MPKIDPQVVAYGAVDELNAQVGVILAGDLPEPMRAPLERIQNELFDLGADLSVPYVEGDGKLRVEQAQIDALEDLCDRFNDELEPLTSFVLPGGTETAARLHVARTVCRRAEIQSLRIPEANPLALALPEPALRPPVHPRPFRQRRTSGAALEARRLALTS